MSSPVHQPKDLDAALMYAPPWARKARMSAPTSAADAPVESPPTGPAVANAEPAFAGDRAMLALRRRFSLDPEIVPEPPMPIDSGLRLEQIALRLCGVASVAALVAWAIVLFHAARPDQKESVHAAAIVPAAAAKPVKLVHVRAAMKAPPVRTAMQAPAVLPAVLTAEKESRAGTDPLPVPAQEPNASQAPGNTLALGSDEIAMLVKRGTDHLMNGDISSARLLLRPAAAAGNAEAALALGSTFDPAVIARLDAIGVKTDAAKARKWYRKAAELGSNLASEQLAKLARAGQ